MPLIRQTALFALVFALSPSGAWAQSTSACGGSAVPTGLTEILRAERAATRQSLTEISSSLANEIDEYFAAHPEGLQAFLDPSLFSGDYTRGCNCGTPSLEEAEVTDVDRAEIAACQAFYATNRSARAGFLANTSSLDAAHPGRRFMEMVNAVFTLENAVRPGSAVDRNTCVGDVDLAGRGIAAEHTANGPVFLARNRLNAMVNLLPHGRRARRDEARAYADATEYMALSAGFASIDNCLPTGIRPSSRSAASTGSTDEREARTSTARPFSCVISAFLDGIIPGTGDGAAD